MATTKITVNNNGSLKVEGDFEIFDRAGNQYNLGGREVLGLCRCGLSKNKPYCDGSHNKLKWMKETLCKLQVSQEI